MSCFCLLVDTSHPASITKEGMEFFARMQFILQKKCDQVGKIVRTELLYYKDTHKTEFVSTPELFKLNKITSYQQLLHLCKLLSGKDVAGKYLSLPTNKDMARNNRH